MNAEVGTTSSASFGTRIGERGPRCYVTISTTGRGAGVELSIVEAGTGISHALSISDRTMRIFMSKYSTEEEEEESGNFSTPESLETLGRLLARYARVHEKTGLVLLSIEGKAETGCTIVNGMSTLEKRVSELRRLHLNSKNRAMRAHAEGIEKDRLRATLQGKAFGRQLHDMVESVHREVARFESTVASPRMHASIRHRIRHLREIVQKTRAAEIVVTTKCSNVSKKENKADLRATEEPRRSKEGTDENAAAADDDGGDDAGEFKAKETPPRIMETRTIHENAHTRTIVEAHDDDKIGDDKIDDDDDDDDDDESTHDRSGPVTAVRAVAVTAYEAASVEKTAHDHEKTTAKIVKEQPRVASVWINRDSDKEIMRRQQRRVRRRRRKRERRARKMHKAFLRATPKEIVHREEALERRNVRNVEMTHPAFCFPHYPPRKLRLWDPHKTSPVCDGYLIYRLDFGRNDTVRRRRRAGEKSRALVWTTHPAWDASMWEIKLAPRPDARLWNPAFEGYRKPPTRDELVAVLQDRLKRERDSLIASMKSAYRPRSSMPCHICCNWTSKGNPDCPCCGQRYGEDAIAATKKSGATGGYNYQDAAQLANEQGQKQKERERAKVRTDELITAENKANMSLAQWEHFKRHTYVRLLIKAMPAGRVVEIAVDKDCPIRYVYFLYRASAGEEGMESNVHLFVPTESGFVQLSDAASKSRSSTLSTWDPGSFTLADYRIEVRNAEVSVLQCNTTNDRRCRAMMSGFLLRNLTVYDKDELVKRMKRAGGMPVLRFCSEVDQSICGAKDTIQRLTLNLFRSAHRKRLQNEEKERLRIVAMERKDIKEKYANVLRKKIKKKKKEKAVACAMHVFQLRTSVANPIATLPRTRGTSVAARSVRTRNDRVTVADLVKSTEALRHIGVGRGLRRMASCAMPDDLRAFRDGDGDDRRGGRASSSLVPKLPTSPNRAGHAATSKGAGDTASEKKKKGGAFSSLLRWGARKSKGVE